jgi:hypothetical protein
VDINKKQLDSLYGHLVKETARGDFYLDNNTPVDKRNPRLCKGCGAKVQPGQHDPCIANLPQTRQACCGHGLAREALDKHTGYVGLNDGRILRFSGLHGPAIRQLVTDTLAEKPLPDGVEPDEKLSWWAGLTDQQYNFVWERWVSPGDIAQLVEEARKLS